MKKVIVCSVLIVFFVFAAALPLQAQQRGDVNDDGQITIIDALFIAQYYIGLDPANFIVERADVDCSGNVDIVDALIIVRYIIQIIPELPACGETPEPAVTIEPVITPSPEDCLTCVQTTVPPEMTTDPIANPSAIPVLTPAPTRAPRVGDVGLNTVFNPIKSCSTFSTTVYAVTPNQPLSSYSVSLRYSANLMVPDTCRTGGFVIGSSTGPAVVEVIDSAQGTMTVRGYDAAGKGPSTSLPLFTAYWRAIDFGETTRIFGNSYYASGVFSVIVNELLDPTGTVIGTPTGIGYSNIYFYSGDYSPMIPSFPN